MLQKRTIEDLKNMMYYGGYVVAATGVLQLVPVITGVIFGEWSAVLDFAIGMALTMTVGFALILAGTRGRLNWAVGMGAVAVSWFVAMLGSAVPYYLSGHYLSYLDACFDVMSGFTTTGLVLLQDLDHVSNAINMWRHLLTFVGGQGMVVMALTLLTRSNPGSAMLYIGEAKDERLLPNVLQTARAIWVISLAFLGAGTLTLWILGMLAGLSPVTAFLEGLWVYMAAWSTGGFAPHTQNILYYHNASYEIATLVFCIIGSFNFGIHYAAWSGRLRELYKNIEIQAFSFTMISLTALASLAFGKTLYVNVVDLFRRGVYHVVSAHTTTGFMTVYPAEVSGFWPLPVGTVLIIAMLLGGSATSTAGGIKAFRVGIVFKSLVLEVRRLLAPQGAIIVEKYHYHRERTLEERTARLALIVAVLYLATFGVLTLANHLAGYRLDMAAFEAASVSGNVGLSSGLTSASMPWYLKVFFIIGMWAGRMEFMTLLVTVGLVLSLVRGR